MVTPRDLPQSPMTSQRDMLFSPRRTPGRSLRAGCQGTAASLGRHRAMPPKPARQASLSFNTNTSSSGTPERPPAAEARGATVSPMETRTLSKSTLVDLKQTRDHMRQVRGALEHHKDQLQQKCVGLADLHVAPRSRETSANAVVRQLSPSLADALQLQEKQHKAAATVRQLSPSLADALERHASMGSDGTCSTRASSALRDSVDPGSLSIMCSPRGDRRQSSKKSVQDHQPMSEAGHSKPSSIVAAAAARIRQQSQTARLPPAVTLDQQLQQCTAELAVIKANGFCPTTSASAPWEQYHKMASRIEALASDAMKSACQGQVDALAIFQATGLLLEELGQLWSRQLPNC
eukprot:CAMPEP_0178450282 /NCGR_PEP_ID=MMETSP0689_2-20121128/43030_1 /TAXON_ID=160604 /ORGANISM="Amphidinium massartii, Strain CS-259" /LENGTH=348 /DNA_ID=CAMNT_0020075715 /DNA_START=99 /DNA_END=1145 /DNA_ORIENTATION=+